MKKMKFMLFAVAAMAAASCAKEIVPENNENGNVPEVNLIPMTFAAGAEDADTKIALQSDGKTIHWESTDKIKVFDGVSDELPAFTTTGSGASVDFTGGVSAQTGTYYALYPYQADAKFGATAQESKGYGNVIKATVPCEQIAVPDGIHSEAFIAAAKSDSGNGYFKFKTLCGFVKFQLSEEDAANAVAVSLSGNDLGSLTGNIEIFFQQIKEGETEPSAAFGQTYVSNQMKEYVTLKGSFKADTDYYFAIRSNSFKEGFTMTILYADGSSKYVTTTKAAPQNVSRNSVMNLGKPVFKPGLPNDLYIAWLHGLNIDIAGEKINKTAKDAVYYNADKQVNSEGVYFIDPGKTITTTFNTISDTFVIMSRFADQKAKLSISKAFQPASADGKGFIGFKGLDITYSQTGQMFQVRNDMQAIVIDNCKVNCIQHTLITATVKIDNVEQSSTVKTVAITNSDIKIYNKSGAYMYMSNDTDGHSVFRFKNNVVYFSAGTTTAMTDFKLIQINNADIAEIDVENNTFDKTVIPNNSLLKVKSVSKNLTVINNLFNRVTLSTFKDGEPVASGINPNFNGIIPQGGSITNNFYYKAPEDTHKLIIRTTGLSNLTNQNNPQAALADILTDWDPENGKYGIAESVTYYNAGKEENVTVSTTTLGAKR